ncbi:MAG: DUF4465 domain-containing protein [Paludisphaera borealis]|uniref:DUF4465 domain-containing protein n=1 Tax=Paludisphaera borealis TaxID=1387353 RepID=UPI0028491853|nr:DUF4465 domain-containing protein [Paludisphaera borealis]MDR3618905.1 DUF4465 domain-containing protein [Paludisphaera borealis]
MLVVLAFSLAAGAARGGDVVATFDDLPLGPESYWRGPDPNGTIVQGQYGPVNQGSFTTGGVSFVNNSELAFGSWSGFAYSNTTDTTTPGYLNQFSAFPGTGHGGGNYGVAFGYHDLGENLTGNDAFDPKSITQLQGLPYFTLPTGAGIAGMFVTNTTYAALSMLQGDSFAKKFGGASGNDPDWFKLTAYGSDAAGNVLNTSVDFYLADYRFSDNKQDYIVKDWRYMDLSALAGAQTIYFNVSSSDVGLFGLNTPGYFAVDDLRYTVASAAVPEPSSLVMASVGVVALAGLAHRRRRVA